MKWLNLSRLINYVATAIRDSLKRYVGKPQPRLSGNTVARTPNVIIPERRVNVHKEAIFNDKGIWLTSNGEPSHFTVKEIACKCGCGESIIKQEMLDKIEELRILIKHPIIVISGYRCVKHNEAVGGANKSAHLTGEAVDFYSPKLSLSQLWLFVHKLKEGFNGVGTYPEYPPFLHCDILSRFSRWVHREDRYWYLF